MPGDPQPVIYCNGNKKLFDVVIKQELQERLVGLHKASTATPTKSDDGVATTSFSPICRGFNFISHDSIPEEEQEWMTFYTDPCLHLYWTDCCDQEEYRTRVKPDITSWIESVEKVYSSVNWLIVYCITKETRSKKKQLGEKIKNDFCTKPEQYSMLKLFSSEPSRVQESWHTLVMKINNLSFATFQRNMQPHIDEVTKMDGNCSSNETYQFFLTKLDIAIGYEMCSQYDIALLLYDELHLLLEQTMMKHASETRSQHPHWLKKMLSSWYQNWDCPDLMHTEKAWKYLVLIHSCSAPLITIRTFLFMRVASLLNVLGRGWLLTDRALEVLHSTARETRALKFNYPDGTFEAWAYMTCMETVSAILNQVSQVTFKDMTSSLLLIRASLWEYGVKKLYKLGEICQLVPTSNAPDENQINRITSGITQQPSCAGGDSEDQGRLLVATLMSKQQFTSKYLELGEMVIGAFKHAGRKRTACSVGLDIAKFHVELGLIEEAERLLSDMCSLYSPENWTIFSANAISLLAKCQKTLHLDSKYLLSCLSLAVLPQGVGTSHDPHQCLDEIVELSKSISQENGVLDWNPLFSIIKVIPDNSEYMIGNTVTMTINLQYNGQKDLIVDSLSLLLRTSIKSLLQSPEIGPGQSICGEIDRPKTPDDNEQSHFTIGAEKLDDLDINGDYSNCSDYRPLCDVQAHVRRTLSETFSSYSLDRASLGRDAAFDEESDEPDFVISSNKIVLHPGENVLQLSGEPVTSGQYYGRKLTLKVGQLSFITMVTSAHWNKGVPVLLKPVDISFDLEPTLGDFYAGVKQKCKITISTGREDIIPQDGVLRLSSNTGIKFVPKPDSKEHLSELNLTLPTVDKCSDWSEYVTVYSPSVYKEPKLLLVGGDDDFVFPVASKPTAWNHEVVIHCQWLMPIHVATLSVTSPEPLSVNHQIYCTPDRSFLQFSVTSHWPQGVKLCEEQLSIPNGASSEAIQVPVPEIMSNEENFSYLWEIQRSDLTVNEPLNSKCSFDLSSQLIMDNDMGHLSVNHSYPFTLPAVSALYCIECTVESVSGRGVTENNLCQLKVVVRCCSPLGTDCPNKFHYSILHDSYWRVLEGVSGTALVENARTVYINVDVVPQMYGELPLPIVDITEHSRRRPSFKGSRQEDVFVPVDKSLVYNSSRGMRVCVYSES